MQNNSNNRMKINTNYIILNLKQDTFFLGGLPTKVITQIDDVTKNALESQTVKVLNSHKILTTETGTKFKINNSDLIFVVDEDLRTFSILIPNYINRKQTSRAYGVVVCKYLHCYTYDIVSRRWEYTSLEEQESTS
ncbi:hypothetical protein CsNV_011 [Callinectes sapidus nudivirus]|nr:hypothetical protein CsNV_011 [Callinectes sapidus nudivirus]